MGRSDIFKWIVLTSCTLATAVVFGTTFTFGSIIQKILEKYHEDRSVTAAVQGLLVGVSFNSGILSGIMVARFGLWKTAVTGATLCSFGFSLAFFAISIFHLYILIGFITGLGCSMTFICSTTAIGMVFIGSQRVFGLAIQSAGLSVAGITLPYFYNAVCDWYGLNGAFLILGGLNLNCFPLAILFFIAEKARTSKLTDRINSTVKVESSNDTIGKQIDRIMTKLSASTQNLLDLFSLPYVILCLWSGVAYGSIIAFMSLIIDILSWKGFIDFEALLVFPIAYASGFVARVFIAATSRFGAEKLLMIPTVYSLCGCCGIILIYLSDGLLAILTGGALIGICQSGVSVTFIVSSQMVGERNLSVGVGLLQTCMGLLAAVLGPFFGSIRDSTKSYKLVLILTAGFQFFAVCMFVITIVAWRKPAKIREEVVIKEISSLKADISSDEL